MKILGITQVKSSSMKTDVSCSSTLCLPIFSSFVLESKIYRELIQALLLTFYFLETGNTVKHCSVVGIHRTNSHRAWFGLNSTISKLNVHKHVSDFSILSYIIQEDRIG